MRLTCRLRRDRRNVKLFVGLGHDAEDDHVILSWIQVGDRLGEEVIDGLVWEDRYPLDDVTVTIDHLDGVENDWTRYCAPPHGYTVGSLLRSSHDYATGWNVQNENENIELTCLERGRR